MRAIIVLKIKEGRHSAVHWLVTLVSKQLPEEKHSQYAFTGHGHSHLREDLRCSLSRACTFHYYKAFDLDCYTHYNRILHRLGYCRQHIVKYRFSRHVLRYNLEPSIAISTWKCNSDAASNPHRNQPCREFESHYGFILFRSYFRAWDGR